MAKWVKSGKNLIWATWVGDAQVVYLLWVEPSPFTGKDEWAICKKVSGAVQSNGCVIGVQPTLEGAQAIAEHDAELPI